MLELQELQPIWDRLNEYKAAWMNESNISKVDEIKVKLRKEVTTSFPNATAEAVNYFDDQCLQIQARWSRPIPGKAIH